MKTYTNSAHFSKELLQKLTELGQRSTDSFGVLHAKIIYLLHTHEIRLLGSTTVANEEHARHEFEQAKNDAELLLRASELKSICLFEHGWQRFARSSERSARKSNGSRTLSSTASLQAPLR